MSGQSRFQFVNLKSARLVERRQVSYFIKFLRGLNMALKLCPICDKYSQICDFCKFYQPNGEDRGGKHGPIYVDKGCCSLHFLRADPWDKCEYFYCIRADEI